MQTKFADGSVGVAGKVTKDAEFKEVGDKKSHIASFSIIAGKRKDTTTIFVNCKAWHGLADYASQIKKGDSVYVVGQIESREWNGKTYEDLNCEWLNVAGHTSGAIPTTPPPKSSAQQTAVDVLFTEISDEEEDPNALPF